MSKIHLVVLSLIVLLIPDINAQDLVPLYNEKGKFGYGISGSKDFVIKPQWDEARPFNEYGIAIVRKGGAFGLIDKQGKPVGNSMGYSLITDYDGTDLWLVAQGGSIVENASKIKNRSELSPYGFKGSLNYPIGGAKWGLLNKDGTFQVQPVYQELSNLMEGDLIIVQKNNQLGVISIDNREVFLPQFDVVTPINNHGLMALRNKKTKKWILANNQGSIVVPENKNIMGFALYLDHENGFTNTIGADSVLKNKSLWSDSEYLIPINNYGSSWINTNYNYVLGLSYDNSNKKKSTVCTLFDTNGKEIIPSSRKFNYIFRPSDDIVVVTQNDHKDVFVFNIVDNSLNKLDGTRMYTTFKDGHALSYMKKNDVNSDYYVIDSRGRCVSPHFDEVVVTDNRLIVKKDGKYGISDLSGREIVPMESNDIWFAEEGLFGIRDNHGVCGYIDNDGEIIIPMDYSHGGKFKNGYVVVGKTSPYSVKYKSGIIDKNNQMIVPFEYEKVILDMDQNGKPCIWVLDNNCFHSFDITTGKLSPTKYVNMFTSEVGTITKSDKGVYGLLVGSEEVIPCSVSNEDAVLALYKYMKENDIRNLNASDARAYSISLDSSRNSFKLNDRIADNFWDY